MLAKELLGRRARRSGRLPEERDRHHLRQLKGFHGPGIPYTIALLASALVLRNGRLVYADGRVVDGGLVAEDGAIVAVFEGDPASGWPGAEEIDAGGRHVLPGVIDPHVQLYPAENFGHYATETRSAALGGVTTIVKMHRDLAGYDAA